MSDENYRRINVLIREDQYEEIQERGLSLSGLIRDMIDDRFSETKVLLSVSKKCKKLYDKVISNFGADDLDLEKYLIEGLDKLLEEKTKEIKDLRTKIRRD